MDTLIKILVVEDEMLIAAKRVQVKCAMNTLNVDVDTAVPLGLIVNELLTNTIKYAFPDGGSGKVQIKLEQTPNGTLQMHVSTTVWARPALSAHRLRRTTDLPAHPATRRHHERRE